MMRKWTAELLHQVRDAVSSEIKAQLADRESKRVIEHCLEKVLHEQESLDAERDAARVYYALSAIVLLAQHPTLAAQTVPKLEKMVKAILLMYKVRPRKSLLSFVYAQLAQALSHYHSQQGQLSNAVWEAALGFTLAQNAPDPAAAEQTFNFARLLAKKGSMQSAAQLLQRLLAQDLAEATLQRVQLELLRCLRLSGDRQAAAALLAKCDPLLRGARESEATEADWAWERAMQAYANEGFQALENWARTAPTQASSALKLGFWLRLKPGTPAALKIPKVARIKAASLKSEARDQSLKAAYKALEVVEDLFDVELSYDLRLSEAIELFHLGESLDVEFRLLSLVILFRWLNRHGQRHLALAVAEEYRALCLRLSQGQVFDVLGLAQQETLAFDAIFNDDTAELGREEARTEEGWSPSSASA